MRRNRLFATVIMLVATLGATAQMQRNARYQAYIDQYHDLAIEQMLKYNIPASITLAQGLFESSAGNSELTRKGNNHFGIKCHGWQGAKTYHDDDARNECFRAYDCSYDSYEDHSKFLSGSRRYRQLFTLKTTDYKGWARGLKECGYATNPAYAKKLIDIIELYDLHKYDKAKKYDKFMVERTREGGKTDGTSFAYTIKMRKKNYYVVARKGDTYRTIADAMGISSRKLARYNERDRDTVLEEGDIVYLKKKRTRASKEYRRQPHVVKAGESLYSISQFYGIRLVSIYELNGLKRNYQIKVGDKLKVR